MLHTKCQQDLAAVRAELTAQIDELRPNVRRAHSWSELTYWPFNSRLSSYLSAG